MRDEEQKVTIARVVGDLEILLPESAYSLWARGELHDFLHLPENFHVEVIAGEIVVSPAARFAHNRIVQQICVAIETQGDEQWTSVSNSGLDLINLESGCIPDAIVLDAQLAQEAFEADVLNLVPDQVELVVEVASISNARHDRVPKSSDREQTKWSSYARAGIPYYLLVDRAPEIASTTLYSIPDEGTGAYLQKESWKFGEVVRLPEPFGVEIPTESWPAWKVKD